MSLVIAATMVGCGSDDPGGEDTQAAASTPAETADPAEFCEASVDVEAAFSMGPPIDESAPPEEQQAALEEFAGQVEPLLARDEETAPDEVAEHVDTAAGIVRDALAGGDPSALESPEYQEADDGIDEYMLAEPVAVVPMVRRGSRGTDAAGTRVSPPVPDQVVLDRT